MAEAHPVGFQWVMEAKRKGATVIHVDPRFTRTSAVADLHVPLRAGSDIALLGALVNHVLVNELDFREYVTTFTNAAYLVDERFRDTEQLDGLFSGFDAETGEYDSTTWQFQTDEHGKALTDPTMQSPHCVWSILKAHFARYTPELVSEVCGIEPEQFAQVADALTSNSGRERTSAICYAVGWTHHSVGVQIIRTAAILQTLLGNMGRPGGGILALRGHASIQGSTDIPTLFDNLPGYVHMPNATAHPDLDSFCAPEEGKAGFWGEMRSYLVSMLKAWYGDAATPENDFCYDYLPRLTGDHSTYQTVLGQIEGRVKGYFLVGENPAVGSANGKMQRLGMANLDWLVVRDMAMIESATFWKDGPEIETGELVTKDIDTEVFFLPCASHVEKSGSFTQTQRMLQWRTKAVEPPGDSRSDLQFYYELGQRIREKLAGSTEEMDRPLLDLTWDYPTEGELDEPVGDAVLREINGADADGTMLSSYTQLKADGSTSAGCWIYTGVYADGVNQSARRKPHWEQSHVAPEWGWVWPANRRIIYNRASADAEGKPWSERKKYVWWDADAGKWVGDDVPDFVADRDPAYRPDADAVGPAALSGTDAFVMQSDGKASLFAPNGVKDGPLPSHFEPVESPVRNAVYSRQNNPGREHRSTPSNPINPSYGETFPYVYTSYRVTEHHTAGSMSRTLPVLSELQPEMFCEVSPRLAAERGLEHGGWATITTARSAIEARVMVTSRLRSLRLGQQFVEQVGLPYHWAGTGVVTGDSVNDLVNVTTDPTVHIQDKVGTCDIRPGRRPRGPALLAHVEAYRARATAEHESGDLMRSSAQDDGHESKEQ